MVARADAPAHVWGLWKRIEVDDKTAQSVLEKHQGLIRTFVASSGFKESAAFTREDLHAVCQMTLLQAHASYDPTKAKFSTWAMRLMQQALIDCKRRSQGIARREHNLRRRQRQLEEYETAVRNGTWQGGEPPAPLTEAELEILVASGHRVTWSLNREIGGGDDHTIEGRRYTLGDTIGEVDEIEERVHDDERKTWLSKKLANGVLTDRQRQVLRAILEDRTPLEIAVSLGVSRQMVEAHYSEAVRKLRDAADDDENCAGLARFSRRAREPFDPHESHVMEYGHSVDDLGRCTACGLLDVHSKIRDCCPFT